MMDLNIVYKHKHYDLFHLEHRFYGELVLNFVKEKKESMTRFEKMKYRAYRKIRGVKFGSTYSSVP